MDYREKGNFLYPFPSPEKEGKTEKEKGFQKEKIEKIKKKKRQNFLRIFPVAPLPLFQKRKEFRKRRGKIPTPSHSHFPSKAGKGNEKKKEKV